MHETGVIRKLIALAQNEAIRRQGTLCAIQIRLGALAGGSPEHMREHFEIALQQTGLNNIRLDITEEPTYPVAVEITSIEITK